MTHARLTIAVHSAPCVSLVDEAECARLGPTTLADRLRKAQSAISGKKIKMKRDLSKEDKLRAKNQSQSDVVFQDLPYCRTPWAMWSLTGPCGPSHGQVVPLRSHPPTRTLRQTHRTAYRQSTAGAASLCCANC